MNYDDTRASDSDTGEFVPELAAAAAAAGRSGGIPLIADANNVIVLPAGATLDDIEVRGRDLVIQLDDGRVYVVPDGAIIVPEIVIDGVAVPPLNLAALLIGNEPEPAAGQAQSSGGNFAEAAGTIQAAYDLGNLLPPTELSFPAQEEREIIPQPVDRNPTLAISTIDNPAAVQDAVTGVAESGLPARGAEPAGSNAAATTETTSGTILFSSPDGIASLTINGTAFTGVGQTFTSPRGVLTITSIDNTTGTIGFTYTLTDNLVGGTVADQFTVVLTDPDGDVATSTLTVNAADDVPTARNDTDALAASTFTPEAGNVITGAGTTSGAAGADTPGADGASVSRVASNAVPANVDSTFDGSGNLQVAGQYGTLLLKADGSYTYTRAAGTPGGVSDAFTYTLTDGDGSTSTATLTIAIADAAPVITSVPTTGPGTIVAESGLPARGDESAGSNFPAPTAMTSGTITFSGGDGPVTATLNGTPVAVGTVIATPSGALTVTSFDPVGGTIGYTFTLTDNTAGDNTSVSFNLVVTDVDGDSAPGTFTISIVDDVPLAVNDSATQATENAAITVNAFANDTPGADSVAFSAIAAVPGTLTGTGTLVYNNDGSFTYTPAPGETGTVSFDYTITDGDGDSSRATVTIALLADSTPTIAVTGDNTVDEAALPARGAEPAGSNAASTDETATGAIAVATGGDTLASLVINGTDVTAGGTVTTAKGVLTITLANGAYTYSYTLTDNTLADPDSDTFTLTVTDSDGDKATTALVIAIADDHPSAADDAGAVAAGTYGPITGSVTANDTPGADGIVVTSYSGVTSGAAGATIQGQYGTLTIAADGTYAYARNAGTPGGVSDTFSYTVTDGDGDTATANLVITIADSGTTLTLPVAGTPGSTQVLEADLSFGSNPTGNGEFASGTFTYTAPDGPATVTIGNTPVTTVGQTIAGSFGTLTITSIANGAIGYTYELTTNTSGDATSDSFAVTVADQDNDSSSGTLTIAIVDDVPTARADADSVTEDGPLVADGNVITGMGGSDANATDGVIDTRGADGASVTAVSFGGTAGTVGSALAGTYGTLVLKADGSYAYTLDNTNPLVQGLDDGETRTDTFSYTLTDGDGDVTTTTLTITINGTNDAPVVGTGSASVSEEGLANANADMVGTPDTGNSPTATGTIAISDVDGEPSTVTLGDPGAVLTSHGNAVTWSGVGTGTLVGSVGATEVIRVVIDNSGNYTVTLSQPIDQPLADIEDAKTFIVPVSVSDGTATVPTTLTIAIEDDSPIANPDRAMVGEGAKVTGNVLTDDIADQFGADGPATTTPAGGVIGVAAGSDTSVAATGAPGTAISTALGTLTLFADGSYTYQSNANTITADTTDTFTYTIRDADGDTSTTTLTINIAAVNGTVTDTDVDVDESGLDGIGSQAVPNGEFDTDGQITVTNATGSFTYTLTSSPANPYGTLVLNSTTGHYDYTLTRTVDNATADDGRQVIGGVESYGYQVTDENGNVIGTGSIVVNVRDDVPTAFADPAITVAEDGANVGGNLLANDVQGADRATVTAVSIDGTTTAIAAMGTTTVTTVKGIYTFQADGTWTYDPAANQSNSTTPVSAGFTYTITDGDGDTSSAAQVINVTDGANPMAGSDISLTVDDQNLATGSTPSGAPVTDSNTISFTAGSDTIASIVFGTDVSTLDSSNLTWTRVSDTQIVGTDTGSGLTVVTLDLVRSGDSATIKATLSNNYDAHPTFTADDLKDLGFATVVATDSDGDFVTNKVNVSVSDDVPTANADAATQATENVAFTIDALANDVFGADRVNLNDATKVFVSTQATQGTVTYDAVNHVFVYTPASGAGSTSTTDSFQYTIVDGDGDRSTATVTVTLQPDSTPTAVNVSAFVDDDGLTGGNPVGDATNGDDNQNRGSETGAGVGNEAIFTGSFAVTTGTADAPLTYTLASAAGSTMVGTELATLTYANDTLTATVAAGQPRAGTVLFTVHIDNVNSGAYTVTLVNPIMHPTLDGMTGDNTENNTSVMLTYTVADSDTNPVGGDTATGTLTIDFDDDVPTADNFAVTQASENQPFSITLAGHYAPGADGVSLTSGVAFTQPGQGTVVYNNDGTFTYTPAAGAGSPPAGTADSFTYTLTDADGDSVTRTVSITLQPDSTPMVKTTTNLSVDEDGFANHNPDGGTAPHGTETAGSNSLTDASGTAVVNFGNDVPANLTGSITLVATAGLDTQIKTLDGNFVTFGVENGVLIGRDTGGAEVIRVTLTGATATGGGDVTYTYSTTLSQPIQHTVSGTEDSVMLKGVTFEVTDSDTDKTTGSFSITVLDDIPSIDVIAGADTGVTLTTRDDATPGSTQSSSAAFGSVFSLVSNAGADGTATTPALSYALGVTSASSGLTSHGVAINLYTLANGTVVGSTATSAPTSVDASAVFSVTVSATGVVTLTQFQAIDHVTTDPSPTGAPFDDHVATLADGLVTLTASSSITDRDGDSASDSQTVNIGANLRFLDAGPSLSNVTANAAVTVDETAAGSPAGFGANGISATSSGAAVSFTAAFGADGQAASGATAYSLSITSAMGATPLKTAIGDFPITLVQVNATTIEGRYTDAGNVTQTAFKLAIDGNGGGLTLTQFAPLEHNLDGAAMPGPNDPFNDALDLSGLVSATVTITDFDGDTASATQAIGGNVRFLDDGPTITVNAGTEANVVLTTHDALTAGPAFDTATSTAAFGNVFSLAFTGGADGAAATPTLSYALGIAAGGAASGLSSHGNAITLAQVGTTIVGYTGATAPTAETDASVVFSVKVSATGVVTLTQYQQVDHPIASDPTPTGTPFDDQFAILADGHITLTASATVTDNDSDFASGAKTIDLGGNLRFADDGPSAVADTAMQATENAPVTINVFANDLPGADGTLASSVALVAGTLKVGGVAATGTLVNNGDGSFTYTPGAGEQGTVTFDYTITDFDGDTSKATATITLLADSTPTLSVTDVTVDEKGLAKGSGEYADHFAGPENPNSDPSETATGTFTITTGGDTIGSVMVQDKTGAFINVTGATVASPITVSGNNGTLSVTSDGAGHYSYSYTLTKNLVHTVQGAGETTPGDSFAVKVTDSDGDTTAVTGATTIDVTVKDDAPVVYAKDTTIAIANSGDVKGTGNFDFTVGADQRTTYSAANSDFSTITLTGTVGSQTITSTPLTWVSESATQATFSFSFTYTASGNTLTENGTLTFDKNLGSYTVDLDSPIQASVSPPSVSGANSIVGYEPGTATIDTTQPFVSVATIPLNAQNTSQLYVQFTGFSEQGAGTGANNIRANSSTDTATPNAFTPGDTLDTNNPDFVSISGSANGVAGDTMGKGEVLNMNFYTADPKGVISTANLAQVSTVFFKFDGIGANEDMIVILKLQDANNPALTTTKAIYVENGDIFKAATAAGLGQYSGISLDNNDGVVIIESNDYNLAPGENWVITGAQITATDEGITGSVINLNGAVGASGGSATTTATMPQTFASDVNDTGFKVSDIGFLTRTTTIQNATLNFTFQVKDSEGDLSPTQTLTANVTNSTTPIALDLDGGGVQFQGLAAGTTFNYGDDGSRVATAWVGKGDGLLAIDLNGNHQVDGGKEIVFSTGALTDLQGLAAKYDTDHNGVLDTHDADFARFGVWQDANGNGVSDAGEFHTLAELGITAIGLVSDGKAYTAAGGDVTVAGNATFTRADGTTGIVADAAFATAELDRQAARTAEMTGTAVAAAGTMIVASAAAATQVSDDALAAPATAVATTGTTDPVPLQHLEDAAPAQRAIASDDALDSHAALPAPAASHLTEISEPAPTAPLAIADHEAPAALGGDAAASAHTVVQATPAFAFASGDLSATMDALLIQAQNAAAKGSEGAPNAANADAVGAAFADTAGSAMVDAIVGHFAGGAEVAAAAPGASASNAELLATLFGGVEGAGALHPMPFDPGHIVDDMHALTVAQA